MKIKFLFACLTSLLFCTCISAKTTNSAASGTWSVSATWDNGVPAAGDVVNILGAHTVSLTAVYDNTAGTITVNGVFFNAVGGSFSTNGTININSGGVYQHGKTGGVIPTCTWAAGSTCLISGTAGAGVPTGLGQSFHHFVWNWATQSANMSLAGALTTVNGNLSIVNVGVNRTLQLATTTSPAITIGGNLTMGATGTETLQLATTGSPTVTVGGNLIFSGGKILMSTTGSPVLTVNGNFTHSAATSANAFAMTSSSGKPVMNVTGDFTYSANTPNGFLFGITPATAASIGTLNLSGNFSYTETNSGYLSETGNGKGVFNFSKAGTQTFSTSVADPIAGKIEININSGSTLDMSASSPSLTLTGSATQTFTVNGTLMMGANTLTVATTNTFVVASGGTLNTSNVSGVNATIIASSGTRVFNDGANYVLNNASTTTGFTGANATMNNLTLTASAVLGEAIIANGTLLNSAGTFATGGFSITAGDLTNNGTFNTGASTISVTDDLTNGGTFNGNTGTITVGDDLTNTLTFTSNTCNLTITGSLDNSGTFDASTGTLGVGGDFSNDGTFDANGGTVAFNGATQSIDGTTITTFQNINHSSTVGTTMNQDAVLLGVLSISDGMFDSNGFDFTLISDASGTASIGEMTGAGDFNGDIIMQRYTENNATDWRFLSSSVTGSLITQWADDFATSGFTGATCGPADCADPSCIATCNYPSIYWYDESSPGDKDQGYVAASDVNDPIVDGLGYWVYMGPSPLTYSVNGPPNKFLQSMIVSYTLDNGMADDGWNLVSNPYPCAIDWDDADWSKTNLDDAIYIYNSSTGTYAYHCPVDSFPINGNGGSQYIASQQAFWVKANGVGAALDAAEGVKASAQTPTFLKSAKSPNVSNYPMAFKDFPIPQNTNSAPNRLKLTATGNGYADEIFVHFKQGATTNYDAKYDVWKLAHPNLAAHNFSSVMNGNMDFSVNGLPPLTADVHIPVRLTVPVTGNYKISRDSALMLPLSSCIILEDKKTGDMIDLRTVVTYTFNISDTTAAPRFILHIYAPATKSAVDVSCNGGNNGKGIALGNGSGPWDYTWKNSAGAVVKTTTASSTADTLLNCMAGTYSVTISSTACGSVTDIVVVAEPVVLATTSSSSDVSCFGDNDGVATVTPSGGTPSYAYAWGNGQTTSAAVNLVNGNYFVTVTDGNGCTTTASVTISQPSVLANTILPTNVSCFGGNDGVATATPTGGTSPYLFAWGSGQTTAAIANIPAGNYSVAVTDAQGCTATASVTLTQPPLLTAGYTASSYTVDIATGSIVTFTNTSSGATSYQWNFGDASGIDVSVNPVHSFAAAGSYTVTLVSFFGPCTDTSYSTIVVINSTPTAITVEQYSSMISVGYENSDVYLLFAFAQATRVNISVYNMLGEEVCSKKNLLVKTEKIKLDIPSSSAGIYIAVSEMTDAAVSKKIIIPFR